MSIEWAWLLHQRPITVPTRELRLENDGRCSVMLLHGLTGTPTELAYVAHYLHARHHLDVRCPQLINHGQPLGVLARTRWHELYESTREHFVLARDTARKNGVPLFIGGLSLGAVLSLSLAAEYPGDVAGVICLSPTLFFDGWNVPWLHRLVPLVDYTPLKYFAFMREESPYGLKDEALRERIAEVYSSISLNDHSRSGQLGYAHFPVRLFGEMRHLMARCCRQLKDVTSPLLLVQARHDDATSPRNSQFILDRVASSQKEILILENSYHVVTADLERFRVAATMARFVDAILARRPDNATRRSEGFHGSPVCA